MEYIKLYEDFNFQKGETRYLIVTEDDKYYLPFHLFSTNDITVDLNRVVNSEVRGIVNKPLYQLYPISKLTMGHDPDSLKRNSINSKQEANDIVENFNNMDFGITYKVEGIFIGAYSTNGLNI